MGMYGRKLSLKYYDLDDTEYYDIITGFKFNKPIASSNLRNYF